MNEHQRRRVLGGLEEVDAIAFARAVSEVEMLGMPRALSTRSPVPASDDVATPHHSRAVVETVVTILLAHAAPVRRIERRTHSQISKSFASFPLLREMFYRATQSAIEKPTKGRCKWHPIKS